MPSLPAPLADSVATACGWQVRRADVEASAPVTDRWLVIGRSDVREDLVEVRRTWLRGLDSGATAMVLSFAAYRQSLDALALGGHRGRRRPAPLSRCRRAGASWASGTATRSPLGPDDAVEAGTVSDAPGRGRCGRWPRAVVERVPVLRAGGPDARRRRLGARRPHRVAPDRHASAPTTPWPCCSPRRAGAPSPSASSGPPTALVPLTVFLRRPGARHRPAGRHVVRERGVSTATSTDRLGACGTSWSPSRCSAPTGATRPSCRPARWPTSWPTPSAPRLPSRIARCRGGHRRGADGAAPHRRPPLAPAAARRRSTHARCSRSPPRGAGNRIVAEWPVLEAEWLATSPRRRAGGRRPTCWSALLRRHRRRRPRPPPCWRSAVRWRAGWSSTCPTWLRPGARRGRRRPVRGAAAGAPRAASPASTSRVRRWSTTWCTGLRDGTFRWAHRTVVAQRHRPHAAPTGSPASSRRWRAAAPTTTVARWRCGSARRARRARRVMLDELGRRSVGMTAESRVSLAAGDVLRPHAEHAVRRTS